MRKKILRSKSGFEKPESREEAIMQNILGASNVLEPSESNIEEILKSILYNTPYTKKAEFEIEKILLAIKNNGTYDGECESRDMKILFAILNDSTYNEEAESRIEELFIEWLYQRSSIKVLEGVPPLTFTSRGLPLINYLIEGNTIQNGTPSPSNPVDVNGVGERTKNLLKNDAVSTEFQSMQYTVNADKSVTVYGTASPRISYIILMGDGAATNNLSAYTTPIFKAGDTLKFSSSARLKLQARNTDGTYRDYLDGEVTLSKDIGLIYIQVAKGETADETVYPMITLSTETDTDYEPYGYKIPVICGDVTTDIYIGDNPLYDGDTISMTDTGIEIPTVYGNNVLTVDTTVQPSNVYIAYK